jgi:hypothetical protein
VNLESGFRIDLEGDEEMRPAEEGRGSSKGRARQR